MRGFLLVFSLHFHDEHPGGDKWLSADKAKHFFTAAFVQSASYGGLRYLGANQTSSLVGASIVGAQAGELITAWTLALSRGLNIRAMTGIVVPYPTLSEIGKRAAISYFSPGLNNPRLRRLISFLRRFG